MVSLSESPGVVVQSCTRHRLGVWRLMCLFLYTALSFSPRHFAAIHSFEYGVLRSPQSNKSRSRNSFSIEVQFEQFLHRVRAPTIYQKLSVVTFSRRISVPFPRAGLSLVAFLNFRTSSRRKLHGNRNSRRRVLRRLSTRRNSNHFLQLRCRTRQAHRGSKEIHSRRSRRIDAHHESRPHQH